jgi:16S rRNA (cytosine967-C5)-methyltransferase
VEKRAEHFINFAAKYLYKVLTRHVGHDMAFRETSEEYRKAYKYLSPKLLYRATFRMSSDYYLLRYMEKEVFGRSAGTKRLAKMWIIVRKDELARLAPEMNIEQLVRKLEKSMPRPVPSLEEVLEKLHDPVQRLAVKYSFPVWFVHDLVERLGLSETELLLRELNEEKWWIRVNTLKTDVERVVQSLEEKGVVVQRDPDLPYMLKVVDYSMPLHHLDEMWQGEIVFQDKASAMVVEALRPEPNDTILDLAAAPGVKDSLIMQLTENRARIIAVDVSWERIKRTKRLLRLYGVDLARVEIINADSRMLTIQGSSIDKVLLDAPCTSTGAMVKDPAVKIHLEDQTWVARFPQLQRHMLETALALRREIVFAVCSILAVEGEEHIASILGKGRHTPVKALSSASPGYRPYSFRDRVHRFFPHVHDTQGFFIAKLVPY